MAAQTNGTARKQVHLNFFETACRGNHESPGQWSRPGDNSYSKDSLDYYIWMAKLAEKAKITGIFFADTYAGHAVYGGNMDAILRSGTQVAQLDPLVIISAMAAVTKSVSIGVTGSTSYIPPFPLARTFSTLDHLTKGRMAWNVVTSWSEAAADAFGKELVPHDQRYEIAEEYMDVIYRLWNGSWADDSVVWDKENHANVNCQTLAHIDSVIFQAGTSKVGQAFAAKHAEAVYIGGLVPSQAAGQIKAARDIARAAGRDPYTIKFFAAINPILGRTLEEAEAKYVEAMQHADVIGALAQFSGYTGIDMSKYPLDEELKLDTSNPKESAVQGFLGNFGDSQNDGGKWTPRKLGEKIAVGGFHPTPIGTAEMVADVMQTWIDEADVDGFNIAYISNPGSFEDIIELLIPELRRRGLVFEDYAVPGGTFRENLLRQPGQKTLRKDHYGSQFLFEGDHPYKPKSGE
ncbi:Nitrilotriacetate monooxygenase component A/pristinamycin IIA synthase subunit A [Amniculicola lignicola CBS 123094]|uniref:Nitrilotriacetate monooxygenase component A/pristinamycin IIA synthase subunit A n=1 Tax=Amniculicola lignicola CBS 123094 TaxID=1392246 RepID=A0A6A5WVK5_9PLEO|nr:Nitrilotriacetate monooxygenase component A/pristinamycin IIA synthase subunit A [Amniculicola lignicola CBS 123094]